MLSCDIAATKADQLVIVELKRTLNLTLLVQATERQKYTQQVYVAIEEPRRKGRHFRGAKRLLKRLNLGLVTVRFGKLAASVKFVLEPPVPDEKAGRPRANKHRLALLSEMAGRSGDYNVGGSTRTQIVTAYRERAVLIACCMKKLGPQSPAGLRRLDIDAAAGTLLSKNYYSWFERISRGIYDLTPIGVAELAQYPEIVQNAEVIIDALPEATQE